MKPIVIAGNGPSLAKIDYRRLPTQWDVFRCNRFVLEDEYYLGKKVHYFNCGGFNTFDSFLLAKAYEKEGFYEFDKTECVGSSIKQNIMKKLYPKHWFDINPNARNDIYEFILKCRKENYPDRDVWNTAGTAAIITAVQQGYNEIYIAGIEFQNVANWTYAYKESVTPCEQNEFDKWHDVNLDKDVIKFINSLPDINLYSIVEDSVLSTIIPLAPIQNDNPYSPEKKVVSDVVQNKMDMDKIWNLKLLEDYLQLNGQNIDIDQFLLYKKKNNFKKIDSIPVLNIVYRILRKIYRAIQNKNR